MEVHDTNYANSQKKKVHDISRTLEIEPKKKRVYRPNTATKGIKHQICSRVAAALEELSIPWYE